MTPAEHRAQRDLVVRSLLVASSRSDRSEERPRKRVAPVPVFVEAPLHVFVLPVVKEKRL